MTGVATAIAGAAVVGAVASSKASSKAASASKKASDTAVAETRRSSDEARADLFRLFPQAQQSAQQGFQGALDVFSQTVPQQAQQFQAGNVAAQQALLTGLPQIQNAILGRQVDLSGFQPFQAQQPDFSFANQQLPQLQPLQKEEFVGPRQLGNQQISQHLLAKQQLGSPQFNQPAGFGNSFLNNAFNRIV